MNRNIILLAILTLSACIICLGGCHEKKEPQCSVVDESTMSIRFVDPDEGENSFGHRIYRLSNLEEGKKIQFNIFSYSNGAGENIFSSESMTLDGDPQYFYMSIKEKELKVSKISNDKKQMKPVFSLKREDIFSDSDSRSFSWLKNDTPFLQEIVLFQYDYTTGDTLEAFMSDVFDADSLTKNPTRSGFVITIKVVE